MQMTFKQLCAAVLKQAIRIATTGALQNHDLSPEVKGIRPRPSTALHEGNSWHKTKHQQVAVNSNKHQHIISKTDCLLEPRFA